MGTSFTIRQPEFTYTFGENRWRFTPSGAKTVASAWLSFLVRMGLETKPTVDLVADVESIMEAVPNFVADWRFSPEFYDWFLNLESSTWGGESFIGQTDRILLTSDAIQGFIEDSTGDRWRSSGAVVFRAWWTGNGADTRLISPLKATAINSGLLADYATTHYGSEADAIANGLEMDHMTPEAFGHEAPAIETPDDFLDLWARPHLRPRLPHFEWHDGAHGIGFSSSS